MEKKITKAMVLAAVKAIAESDSYEIDVNDVTVTSADIVTYCETTVSQLAAKNEKAKERAAEKRAKSDELKDAVHSVVTEEWQTAEDITAAVEFDGDEVTKGKVVARLSKLVNEGLVEKQTARIDKRTIMTYRLQGAVEAAPQTPETVDATLDA